METEPMNSLTQDEYIEFLRYAKEHDYEFFEEQSQDNIFNAFSFLMKCHITKELLHKDYEARQKKYLEALNAIKDKKKFYREVIMIYQEEYEDTFDFLQKILDSRYQYEAYHTQTSYIFEPEVKLPPVCPWRLEEILKDVE